MKNNIFGFSKKRIQNNKILKKSEKALKYTGTIKFFSMCNAQLFQMKSLYQGI